MSTDWKSLFEPEFGKFDTRKFTCICGATLSKPAKFNCLMHLQNSCPMMSTNKNSIKALVSNLVAITVGDPLGWRYRAMRDGTVKSKRLPGTLGAYGYAWTCYNCEKVIPLEQTSVEHHIANCKAQQALVKFLPEAYSAPNAVCEYPLKHISDY